MHHDPSDLESLIRIQMTPKERTLCVCYILIIKGIGHYWLPDWSVIQSIANQGELLYMTSLTSGIK